MTTVLAMESMVTRSNQRTVLSQLTTVGALRLALLSSEKAVTPWTPP
uniref:Uncharacterized protein n=1 Tax=Brassica campestris TaxID=3711 RepID=A0A3P5ZQN7_BRACM|nr:unnamed protein product [Brassica rapa]